MAWLTAVGSTDMQRQIDHHLERARLAAGVAFAGETTPVKPVVEALARTMGGTTAKATVIENHAYAICPETEVGGGAALGARMIKGAGYPVQSPTIDIAEVGAGGGSIAATDAAGGLIVGPRSAGAEPGPVAYGRGGTHPTVTDANIVLGYLNPGALVSGELTLDVKAAMTAISSLGEKVGLSSTDTAYGIHVGTEGWQQNAAAREAEATEIASRNDALEGLRHSLGSVAIVVGDNEVKRVSKLRASGRIAGHGVVPQRFRLLGAPGKIKIDGRCAVFGQTRCGAW